MDFFPSIIHSWLKSFKSQPLGALRPDHFGITITKPAASYRDYISGSILPFMSVIIGARREFVEIDA